MKKKWKALLPAVIAALMCMLVSVTAGAASTRRCYLIQNKNETVYSNTGLTRRYGSIYGSDEIRVLTVTDRYCKVTYPLSWGGYRTGYIRTSAILVDTTGPYYTAKAKITTYRRPGGSAYGYVAKGDQVRVLGTYGNYTQVKYPVSGGYKFAFVKTSDANKYIKGSGSTSSSSSSSSSKTKTATSTGLTSPVPSGCKFSMKTYDSSWYGYHDINRNVSTSTPVYAIADGTVVYKQAYTTYYGKKYLTSYGNFVVFTANSGGYTAKYCHLSRFNGVSQIISSSSTKQVRGSQNVYTLATKTVKKGDILGYIGTTGNSSGVHLHFELFRSGTRIDPTSVFSCLK